MKDFDKFAESLISVAHQLPARTICGEAGPYLTRYTVSDLSFGGRVYLHRFHRSDADRDLHSHPWAGISLILSGGYSEERRDLDGVSVHRRRFGPGDVVTIAPETFHRVDLLESESWSLFTASEKVQEWGFWSRDTGFFTPWREALERRGLL